MLTRPHLDRLLTILNSGKKGSAQAALLPLLLEAVERPARCLPWNGNRSRGGYGVVQFARKGKVVHKVIWEMLYGTVPKGMLLNHLTASVCNVGRACANPAHVELTTYTVNAVKDSARPQARKVVDPRCDAGHRLVPRDTGRRLLWCPVCDAERERKLGKEGQWLALGREQLRRFVAGAVHGSAAGVTQGPWRLPGRRRACPASQSRLYSLAWHPRPLTSFPTPSPSLRGIEPRSPTGFC